MSIKEVSRGEIFSRVHRGEMSLKSSVELLGLSYRQAKRLYSRFRDGGSSALVHGNVGRPSNRRVSEETRLLVLDIVASNYGGVAEKGPGQRLGPTLVSEQQLLDHELAVPRTTVRRWMQEAGLWTRVRRSNPKTYARRDRRAHFGELLQLDGSFHDWYEGRGSYGGKQSCMMALVDDATSTTATGEAVYTQFGFMCAKLGIEIIGAGSPQAKGRVERSHGTHQDRLIKKLRLADISDDASANSYLEDIYMPRHNSCLAVPAVNPLDCHTQIDSELNTDDVWCLEQKRVIGNDHVVRYNGMFMQIDRRIRGRVPAKAKVLIREREDGQIRIVHVGRTGKERVCDWTPITPAKRRKELAKKRENESRLELLEKPAKQPWKPATNHPWRKSMDNDIAIAKKRKEAREQQQTYSQRGA